VAHVTPQGGMRRDWKVGGGLTGNQEIQKEGGGRGKQLGFRNFYQSNRQLRETA